MCSPRLLFFPFPFNFSARTFYNDLIEEPRKREVITIYEVDATKERS